MNEPTQKTSCRVRAGCVSIPNYGGEKNYVPENQAPSQRSLCLSEEGTTVQSFA